MDCELFVVCLHGWLNALFPQFHQSDLTIGDLNLQILKWSLATSVERMSFRSLFSTPNAITNDLYKHFMSRINYFLGAKLKDSKSHSLMVCHFTDLQWWGMHSTQKHLNVSCTKTPRSVRGTDTAVTHSRLTQRYLATHSSTISVEPSNSPVRILSARISGEYIHSGSISIATHKQVRLNKVLTI
jgi:hypothetical protein